MRSNAQHPILMRFFATDQKFAQLYLISSGYFTGPCMSLSVRLNNDFFVCLQSKLDQIFLAAFFD